MILPISQFVPVNPTAQIQSMALEMTTQVAPFRHGLRLTHSVVVADSTALHVTK